MKTYDIIKLRSSGIRRKSHWVTVSRLFEETIRFHLQRPDVREEFDVYTREDKGYTVLLKVAK